MFSPGLKDSLSSLPLPTGAATEATLDSIKTDTANISANSIPLIITQAINQTSFDLNAAPFSATTNISNDFILDNILLHFSTNQSKTITITAADGTVLYGGSNDTTGLFLNVTTRDFKLRPQIAVKGGQNITVAVTQTSGACSMDCIVSIRQGSQNLTGNPVLATGTNIVGKFGIVNSDMTIGINPAKEDGNLATLNTTVSTTSFDTVSQNIIVVRHSHEEIHAGNRFIAHEYTSLTNNETRYYKIVTSTAKTHMLVKVNTNAEIIMRLFKGSTITVNGSKLSCYNRNQNYSDTCTDTIYAGSTVTVDGTEIEAIILGSGKSFGDARGEDEFVLAPSTTYVVKITANAAANYSINFDHYHTA